MLEGDMLPVFPDRTQWCVWDLKVSQESFPLSQRGSPHQFSPSSRWVQLGIPYPGCLEEWCAVPGSRHADTVLDGWGLSKWIMWRYGTDRTLMLIEIIRCYPQGHILLSACIVFGSNKGCINHQNWPYIFLFACGSCLWAADPNIGGIGRK